MDYIKSCVNLWMDFDFDIMMMNLRTCFYAFLIAYTVFLFWFMLRTTLKLFMKDPVFVQLPLEWWQQQKKICGKPRRLYSSCRYLKNCLEINLIQHFLLVRFVYSINKNISWFNATWYDGDEITQIICWLEVGILNGFVFELWLTMDKLLQRK